MPTAVERILSNVLKLDSIDNPAAQRLFSHLDDEIGPGFRALDAAATKPALVAAEHRYGHVFTELGAGAYNLGGDLQHDAGVLNVVNELLNGVDIFGGGGGSGRGGRVSEVWGGGGGSGRGGIVADIFGGGGGSGRGLNAADIYGAGGGSGVPAGAAAFGAFNVDLLKVGADLKKLGADLARIGHASSPGALAELEGAFRHDLEGAQDDFVTLGGDAGRLGEAFRGPNGGPSAFADALAPVAEEASKIGADFGAIADIFGGGGGSGFSALQHDISLFGSSLQGLAAPLAGLLVPAVHPVT